MKIQYQNQTSTATTAVPWIRRLALAWLTAAAVEYLLVPEALRSLTALDGIAAMSAVRMVMVAAVVFGALWGFSRVLPEQAERWLMFGVFAVLAVLSLMASFTWAFLAVCLLLGIVLLVYALLGWDDSPRQRRRPVPESRGCRWLAMAIAVAFCVFVSVWTVCRVYSFCAPTFDFTIFAQMFHSMKETGLPMTTVERDGPLSHFAVHVSPIYYLLLPFYCLVPHPATLQALQAVVLASGVLPLWKLGKHHGLAPWQRVMVCLLLALYPAYSGGTSYDIHENAFLTPLILWLFYGIDRKNGIVTGIFALLTCMVKEDAAVYVAVIALWLMLRGLLRKGGRWDLMAGGALLAGSVAYFLAVTGYLASSGDGVMTYRYRNFMFDGSDSLMTVIKAVLLCPMKAVFECVDPEKLKFIGLTLGPLLGLPLLTRRYERYILLIPYILVNLMSDYQYQHDIFFQYAFGSTACLFYLTVVNLADLRLEKRKMLALGGAVCISALCFGGNILPKALVYPNYCATYGERYAQRWDFLEKVPEEASVAATTYYSAALSQRAELYDIRYASREHILGCEYVVVSLTETYSYKTYATDGDNGRENFQQFLVDNGYEIWDQLEGQIVIYRQ
ncbi:MAG: DUF2079 domain-containing protein [Oscillospiraceae bacterium]|nr:DUF2079 domain-containing protein [Oscillospiraceae bacterium]